jgi:FtsH-binding integral membrane protein
MAENKKNNQPQITNIDRKLNLLLGTFAIVVCILIFTSLNQGSITCRNFIPNIYLYVILAILIVGIFTLLREKYFTPKDEQYKLYNYYDIPVQKYFATGFTFGILAIISLFIYFIANLHTLKNHFLNHTFWIIILFGISSLFYPLFKLKTSYNYIDNAAIYVIMIFFVMSGIIYTNYNKILSMNNKNNQSYNWIGMGLLGALITIILANIFLIIFSSFGLIPSQSLFSFTKIILYFAIVIFSLYISYDTIYIIKRTKTCNTSNINNYPNYPMESFQIFIDLYNIFADLLHLQNLQSLTNYM